MLIQKSAASEPNNGDIVTLKLLTGEEIIGKMSANTGLFTDGYVVVDKPVVLQVSPTPKGLAMAFTPVLFAGEENASLKVFKAQIAIGPVKARQEIAAQFIKSTTGLEVPINGGIIQP